MRALYIWGIDWNGHLIEPHLRAFFGRIIRDFYAIFGFVCTIPGL